MTISVSGARPVSKPLGSPALLTTSQKTSQRITVTIPDVVLQGLIKRSNDEGRSISNLVAFLVEKSLVP